MAPINLNRVSIVKPIILKGNRNSHTSGNNTNIIMAIGQQRTNRRHQRINPINILMTDEHAKLSPV